MDCLIYPFIVASGVHANTVESYSVWNNKRIKGMCKIFLPSYLDEFMWQEGWGGSAAATFDDILSDIRGGY